MSGQKIAASYVVDGLMYLEFHRNDLSEKVDRDFKN